ncbi:nitroreductase family protein [Sediminivirga luteola]|uniref:nitroreductase family protein n=1 Tax=Sediminivirga luteola TaxID=1774748 RepID=UPI001667CD9B|nr:nitroreductase family protein [Sediminivirga luteola]MCI2264682.1 nitroreductase family protein [Sediminivirga luteola]
MNDRFPTPLERMTASSSACDCGVQNGGTHEPGDDLVMHESAMVAERFERFRAPETPRPGVALPPGNIEAHLRLETHRIEKGLSIAEPRRPFGRLAQERLTFLLALAAELSGKGDGLVSAEDQAREALRALQRWNSADRGTRDPDLTQPALLAPDDGPSRKRDALTEFFAQRSSVRSFDPEKPVSPEAIERAVEVALHSPSVCNRAAGRVHFYEGRAAIGPLLDLQQGNRGLTGIRHLAVATVELSMFAGAKELTQPWIDGGLFLMNLVWGFQSQGIGSCLLNWSMPDAASRELRKVAAIPESELIVCMLAFGYAQEGTYVTRSAKPPLAHVMTLH